MPTPIIVVGLGPGAWAQVTLEAQAVLAAAETVWLRTTTHPTTAHLPAHLHVESFDYLYAREATFGAIYHQIAATLIAQATDAVGSRQQAVGRDEPVVSRQSSVVRDEPVVSRQSSVVSEVGADEGAGGGDPGAGNDSRSANNPVLNPKSKIQNPKSNRPKSKIESPLVYCVPGHPLVGEASVRHLLGAARAAGVPVRIVAGLSFLEPVCTALELDPLQQGLQILDGAELLGVGAHDPAPGAEPFYFSPYPLPVPPAAFPTLQGLSPLLPALITQVYSDHGAGAIKLALLEKYPPDHPVRLVMAAGVPGQERVIAVPLAELDHGHQIDHLACVYLPPLEPLAHPRELDALIYLMGRLRGPGGCPWDREQSHASLRRYLLEETYEAVDAIDAGDPAALAEELGDVLLQVVFHAQIAAAAEEFTLGDVVQAIVTKLVRRHPHVFGSAAVADAAGVVANWQTIKAAEQQAHAAAGGAAAVDADLEVTGLLRRVPQALPALQQSHAIAERAVAAGFEWDALADVFAKLQEELDELRTATDPAHRQEELGDLLFTLVNIGRWWGVNLEETLRATNRKFIRRFAAMERLAVAAGRPLRGLPVAEMDRYWQAAKRAERET
ncbi:MAG TPA: nucleoside triphosphate pyrophosphohydrolase [Chloroflexia bacterium]|nr:nucleoside triphosphate pyrophosphohydrolase [Chloroflexia bacterium]